MGFLNKLFGGGGESVIGAFGDAGDKLFTSDEERAQWQAVKMKMALNAAMVGAEIDKAMLSHRSLFVAGGRPFIIWVCGFGLLYQIFLGVLNWGAALAELPPLTPIDAESFAVIAWTAGGVGVIREVNKWRGVER